MTDPIRPDRPASRGAHRAARPLLTCALAGCLSALPGRPALAAPPAPAAVVERPAPTPTLGDRLRAIDAFDDPAVDPRLVPPPPPAHIWPEVLTGTGAAMIVAGLVGMVVSPTCATRTGDGRCLDARGSAPVWPALIVVGLGATVTGSYWYRWSRLPGDD